MSVKAIFLDFYGTLVHEDDEIIPLICKEVRQNAVEPCDIKEIGSHWWQGFSNLFQNSYGDSFRSQRELTIDSLQETMSRFKSTGDVRELVRKQFAHWVEPVIYADTLPFLEELKGFQVYILSNIDTADVLAATTAHGIRVDGIYTSEDVRSYKPRPELFLEALSKNGLLPQEVIHIGDSLTSDVGGASRVGITTVWLNRLNKQKTGGPEPDYICNNLTEVTDLIRRIKERELL
ncbi:HAD family hydrolase [Paenibacillus sp. DYY-L-2]|uniref:HAD family hydrolase n=1 Tax=Paenibacillus sp. DYY-L-2 TaxID=3447013 RepID=UPI003F50BB95